MELADMAKDAVDKDVSELDPEVKRLAGMLFTKSDIPKLGDVFGGIGIQRTLTSVENQRDKSIPVSHDNKLYRISAHQLTSDNLLRPETFREKNSGYR